MKKILMYVLICMLVSASIGMSVAGTVLPKQVPYPLTTGNILYVGGSGPNNYTRIQDAIDNASDGDTVFVYDDSSPYFESVVIDKSISLVGEEKNTTIIDGNKKGDVVFINVDGVTISNFSIINSQDSTVCNKAGIMINASYTIIFNNIVRNNFFGIASVSVSRYDDSWLYLNVIKNNIVHSNSIGGIWLCKTRNSSVVNNIVFDNYCGILLNDAIHNSIVGNTVTQNTYAGVHLVCSNNNVISENHIINNECIGIAFIESKKNIISQNNFIDNGRRNAIFLSLIKSIGRNTWDGNYWDNTRLSIYPIFGRIALQQIVEIGIIPCIQFDWRPAQEPYDIPGMT